MCVCACVFVCMIVLCHTDWIYNCILKDAHSCSKYFNGYSLAADGGVSGLD